MNHIIRKFIKFLRLIRVKRYRYAMAMGVAAGIEHESFLHRMQKKGVTHVIDIGANVGQFSLATRHCIPAARVIAFEPLAKPAKTFKKVFIDDELVKLNICAIGPEKTITQMNVSKSHDSSSLLNITNIQENYFPGTGYSHEETVKIIPLDEILSEDIVFQSSLLKIDVQGFELEVLKGCEPLLDRFHTAYIECSFIELYEGQALAHQVIEWLYQRNFHLVGMRQCTSDRSGDAIQADFIFQFIAS